ncbi:MAG TPA: GDSL-type esterase/lipase family protein [Puia sp.]|nr:GDSL-type esterase/lipase family protein [Puia sp.]
MKKPLLFACLLCIGLFAARSLPAQQVAPGSPQPALGSPQPALSAQAPFWSEIADFKRRDSLHHPPSNAILFVGSSSFRKWTNVQADFPGYTIINRGFGGSTLDDVIHYAGDIIYPYKPKQVVIYCGDNDLASDRKVSGKKVYKKFGHLYDLIRKHLGNDVDILYVSIKPSPSREKLMPEMERANDMIRNFMAQRSHASFVDVYHLMLNAQGHPMDDLFIGDKLHMSEKGYKLWQQAILPYLDK